MNGYQSEPLPFTRIIVALAILAAVLVAGIALVRFENSGIPGFEPVDRRLLFPSLAERLNEIYYVEITGPSARYRLKRSQESWRLLDRDGYPVPKAKVDEFLKSLADLTATYVSMDDDLPAADYGVAPYGESNIGVGTTVVLLDRARKQLSHATLGYAVSVPGVTGHKLVVRRENSPQMWMVESNDIRVPGMPVGWLGRGLVDIPPASITKFTIIPPNNRPIVIERTQNNNLMIEKGTSAQEKLRGPWILDQLVSAFKGLTFVDVRTAIGVEALDREPWRLELATEQGLTYQVRLFRTTSTDWATFVASAEDREQKQNARQFNSRHSAWAYRLPYQVVSRFTTEVDQFAR